MERIIRKDKFGNIACNNIIIYTSKDKSEIGKLIRDSILTDFEIIEPKYYKYIDDESIIEIWYDTNGIVIDNGLAKKSLVGFISEEWNTDYREQISYKEAMEILDKRQNKDLSYNNKDLMSSQDVGYSKSKEIKQKQNNNGGASDWYSLPKKATTLQDLIEHRNMNGSVKDIFKACYRLGIKTEDELRDLNKMAYYSLREIGRITGRKDYITIAKELMGSQAIEKDENEI